MRILLISVLIFVSNSTFAADSLVPNGNFETDTTGTGWPDGWGKNDGLSWEKDGAKHFMRLTANGQQVLLFRVVSLKPGLKALDFKIRFRTNSIKTGTEKWHDARVVFHFLDAEEKALKPDPEPVVFPATSNDWEERTARLEVPEGSGMLQIMPGLFNAQAGTLDLSEISIVPVEAP
jgi:hypothetical protein